MNRSYTVVYFEQLHRGSVTEVGIISERRRDVMAKAGEVSFLGNSRTVYKFGVYTLDTNFTDIGAVYIFCSTNAKGQHQPRYVGATGELGHHIQDHSQWLRNDPVARSGALAMPAAIADVRPD